MKKLNKQNKLLVTTAVVLSVALLAVAPNVFSNKKEKENEKELAKAPAAVPDTRVAVDAYAVQAATIEDELQTTGTLEANQEVNLVTEVARKVTAIYAQEGSYVRQGTVLFKLDDADLLARKKKLTLQEKLALLDEKRFRELLATESVNQQEYDQVSTNLKVLQAEIGIVDVDLEKTRIRAPFSGKIGLNKVDVGAYVTPATVLASLEDVSQVEVNFTVPEKYASEVKPGQTIRFTTENSNLPFQGKVVATEPKTDLNTRSLAVKALSDNREGKLVPGTSAKIQFSLRKTQDGILIPSQALIPTPKGYSLFTVKNGQAELREVKTGTRTKATVQILEGLALGDTVITTNLLRLGPAVPVQVVSVE
jgi:membrane fusion protein, multidrug efflux system